MSKNDSRKPIMLYRVCIVFFLFLAVLFYWRCTKAKGDDFVFIPPQQCDGENDEFSNPQPVTISGYTETLHAMEPFISRDNAYLFFNSLNDANDTSIYYATSVDESVTEFASGGKLEGVNQTAMPHLDAVPSMDEIGQFYFISTRDYKTSFANVFTGIFSAGTVTPDPLEAVGGDFYIAKPGWIIMDCEVSPDGEDLYFVNAQFKGGSMPSVSKIGVASRVGEETTFNKDPNSDMVMAMINKDGCLDYAPSITEDGKELFFTRICFGSKMPSILVAKRDLATGPFGKPACISVLKGSFVEAPSLSSDKARMYYHRRDDDGVYRIYMVSRAI